MYDGYDGGWIHNPEEVEKVLSRMDKPFFCMIDDQIKGTGEKQDVFFWEAEKKVVGNRIPAWNQGSLGSCIAHGAGRAAQDLLLIQISLGALEQWQGQVAREPIYGGCRVEVGHQFGSYSDGATGAWAAEWLQKWGVVIAKKYDAEDLTDYDVVRCRAWGAKGVPKDIETIAKQHPIKDVKLIKTVEETRDALANGYPVAICGNLGRTMKRQEGGWCPVLGTWTHCQELCGVCVVKGNKPAFCYRNSWADYLGSDNNKVQLESGREIELPDGCYLSDFDSVGKDLQIGDTFAYSHATAWPAQKLSWLI